MSSLLFFFFFFNDTATTEIYTLSLHDALPISLRPIPFLVKLLRTLLHCAKSYPLSFHAILDSSHKTPGGGGGSITKTKRKRAPSRPGRDKLRSPVQGGQPRKRRMPGATGRQGG